MSERSCYLAWRKQYLKEHPTSEAFKNSPTVGDALEAAFLSGIKHGGHLCTVRAGLAYSARAEPAELSLVPDATGWSDSMKALTYELSEDEFLLLRECNMFRGKLCIKNWFRKAVRLEKSREYVVGLILECLPQNNKFRQAYIQKINEEKEQT